MSNTKIREITWVQPVDNYVIISCWIRMGHFYRKQGIVRDIPGCVAPDRRSRGKNRET